VLPDQMGDAMGQGTRLATTGTCHNEQRAHVMINSAPLSIV
jgi:hypothetical protein